MISDAVILLTLLIALILIGYSVVGIDEDM